MVTTTKNQTKVAHDGFEAFYTEKIWALIPGVYRDEDARSKTPGALRAFTEILAKQAARERRSVDRLWTDAHITDCDDWAIPYIADLLATRLVSEQNTAGRRADVANTISYRRRSGTLHLLEQLADDIAGWDAVASEAFKRLFRNWHRHDCPPILGPFTKTPQGGYARLKSNRIGNTVNSAFDDVAHFPDFRQLRGHLGRYNIPKINLHIFRQFALPINNSKLHKFVDEDDASIELNQYAFDPSGRDIPLFMPGRSSIEDCTSPKPWEVRGPMSCWLLNSAYYTPTGPESLVNEIFENDDLMIRRIENIDGPMGAIAARAELNAAILPASAKMELIPKVVSLAIMPPLNPELSKLSTAAIAGGNLANWETVTASPAKWIRVVIDPARGRIWLANNLNAGKTLESLRYYYGQFFPLGAGSYDRRDHLSMGAPTPISGDPDLLRLPGTEPTALDPTDVDIPTLLAPVGHGAYQFNDSFTYHHIAIATTLTVTENPDPPGPDGEKPTDLIIQAKNGERPYIVLSPDGLTNRWEIDSDDPDRTLVLDGLWLGLIPETHGSVDDGIAAPVETELVLKGSFERVTLRHMTLDPGGKRARTKTGKTFVLPYVKLKIVGQVEELIIERSITGPIEEDSSTGELCSPTRIKISDSIIRSPNDTPAIKTRTASLEMQRTTVFGDVKVSKAFITDSLIQGVVQIVNTQNSCFRYSAAPSYPDAEDPNKPRIPQPYKSVVTENAVPNHMFISRRFGDPGYAQLSETAIETIRRGAENTSEMGAFNCALEPIKRDDLIYKIAEFTGINVIPQLIMET